MAGSSAQFCDPGRLAVSLDVSLARRGDRGCFFRLYEFSLLVRCAIVHARIVECKWYEKKDTATGRAHLLPFLPNLT